MDDLRGGEGTALGDVDGGTVATMGGGALGLAALGGVEDVEHAACGGLLGRGDGWVVRWVVAVNEVL